jgi:REP element-mobilizing transposase RayT
VARKKRIWYPGAIYHVMSRGNRRSSIFKEEWDYEMFIVCLKNVKEVYDFKIYSICLMTNHFHMVVGTEKTEIWKIMHKLLLSYAASYSARVIHKLLRLARTSADLDGSENIRSSM